MNTKSLIHLIVTLCFFSVSEKAVQAQHYNLEVGTERYFNEFGGLGNMPIPLGIGAISLGKETVIGEKEIDGITWSKVVWERTANYDYPQEHIRRDTTLLREQEGKLYEYKANNEEKLIFDYGFSVGDSILEHFEPFMSEKCLEQDLNPEECIYRYYMVNPPHRIQIDTTVTFPDGTEQRVLWGPPSDFQDTITAEVFVDSILTESSNMLLPLNAVQYWENASFYFVDGWGVVRTPVNHRNIYMNGIIKPDGQVYGYHSRRSFLAPGPVRMSIPEAGKKGVEADENGNIMFHWKEAVLAETYHLQIALDERFEDKVIEITDIEDTTTVIDTGIFEPLTGYWWRIRAINDDYTGDWGIGHESKRYFSTGIDVSADEDKELPKEISLQQNHPNPFNPITQISYSLPEQTHVRLEVYNALGQLVAMLVNENKSAGRHEAMFDATGLSSGIYLYRLQTQSDTGAKQMLLIK